MATTFSIGSATLLRRRGACFRHVKAKNLLLLPLCPLSTTTATNLGRRSSGRRGHARALASSKAAALNLEEARRPGPRIAAETLPRHFLDTPLTWTLPRPAAAAAPELQPSFL
eukprot:CAMPEP_0119357120 /NCGR_PEP_ID=MMETSP1334-20130426/5576_1 /TAXON_ID=127549 /ORGANISM="Calcidiscus leptoporus, Strain RCC1130" /LENGTH=112 /DNA_ID=CAMNT_0007371301 /DNA_START=73 /DNA_END=411 /DNA_ORIENTATION=+